MKIGSYCLACQSLDCAHTNARKRPPHLTPRQVEIVRGLVVTKLNKQIAYDMGLTEETVRCYLVRIYDLLNVTNRFEAAMWGLKHLGESK